jgi:hypothetical protein
MQTNIKGAMTLALKKYLTNINTKILAKEEKKDKKRKYSREDVVKIWQTLRELGFDETKVDKQMNMFSILFDAPELKQGPMIPLEQNCVVVVEANASGHGILLHKPYILTYLKERHVMIDDGRTSSYAFHASDKPRLATFDEIDSCVDALAVKQWASIFNENEACLKELRNCVMNCQVECSEGGAAVVEGRAGNEVELANGRVITMNDE